MGAGSKVSWPEYAATWGKVNNVKVTFESVSSAFLEPAMGTLGRELADMFGYFDEFGYDGSDPETVYPWDLKEKFGVDVKYTTLEEYMSKQDYSSIL